jgi:hypothetical protein
MDAAIRMRTVMSRIDRQQDAVTMVTQGDAIDYPDRHPLTAHKTKGKGTF